MSPNSQKHRNFTWIFLLFLVLRLRFWLPKTTKQQNKNNNNLLLISRKERRRENSSEMKLYPWNLGMDFHTHKQEFNVPG